MVILNRQNAAMTTAVPRVVATPKTPQVVTFEGSPFRLHQTYEPAVAISRRRSSA